MSELPQKFLNFIHSPVGAVGMMAYVILVSNLLLLLVVEGIFHLAFDRHPSGMTWGVVQAILLMLICIPALNYLILQPMKQQQAVLQHQFNELRIAATTFECQDGVIVTDADKRIIKVNHAFSRITGYTSAEAVGKTPALLSSGRHDKDFYQRMWATLEREKCWSGEIWNLRKNGKVFPEWLTITPINDESGKVVNYVGIFTDITQRKAAELEVYNLAFYDSLTHLPNRRLFNDRLIHAMATSRRSGRYGAVMFIDLDNFKPLNDLYGHNAGDLLLIEAANRLRQCVREVDTVARFGGDEFVVILSELDYDKADSIGRTSIIADKIRNALSAPYVLSIQKDEKVKAMSVEHLCTSSIGVAMFINHQGSHEEVLMWADLAMYRAKNNGRDQICFYDPHSALAEAAGEVTHARIA
jgi:diguanylate cyclase (GGDEF)-like protein/PAS domain S-box-containing protein